MKLSWVKPIRVNYASQRRERIVPSFRTGPGVKYRETVDSALRRANVESGAGCACTFCYDPRTRYAPFSKTRVPDVDATVERTVSNQRPVSPGQCSRLNGS